MGEVIIAVDAILAILKLVQELTSATNSVITVLQKAHEEGRDLTDEEMMTVIQLRKAAEGKILL